MAYAMTKRGSQDNCITYEFICDTIADMNAIENKYRTIGTVAIVLSGESEGLEVYIAGSNREWNSLSSAGGSTGGGSASLQIYICSQNEVDQGLPDVDEPDETTIYLVPAGNTSGNLYEEYIYVDNAWEKFGAGTVNVDLSNYVTQSDINGKANSADLAAVATTGSYNDLSNKPTIPDVSGFYTKPNSGIPASDLAADAKNLWNNLTYSSGTFSTDANSFVLGGSNQSPTQITGCLVTPTPAPNVIPKYDYTGSLNSTTPEANDNSTKVATTAYVDNAFLAWDNGDYAMLEDIPTNVSTLTNDAGYLTQHQDISGLAPKANPVFTGNITLGTRANGSLSGTNSLTVGENCRATSLSAVAIGDRARSEGRNSIAVGLQTISQQPYQITLGKYNYYHTGTDNTVIRVGNGASDSVRSDAFTLDWDGNGYFAGDVYVGCNANSTGGTKLAKLTDLPDTSNFITVNSQVYTALINRIEALEARVSDLEDLLHVTDAMAEGEDGRPVTDENGNTIDFDR